MRSWYQAWGASKATAASQQRRLPCVKVVVLGDAGVGKTSVLGALLERDFRDAEQATMGAAFHTHNVRVDDGTLVKLQLWDTAGLERFSAMVPRYTRQAHVAVLVCSLDDDRTLASLARWAALLPDACVRVVLGNKADRVVVRDHDGERAAQALGATWLGTVSARRPAEHGSIPRAFARAATLAWAAHGAAIETAAAAAALGTSELVSLTRSTAGNSGASGGGLDGGASSPPPPSACGRQWCMVL